MKFSRTIVVALASVLSPLTMAASSTPTSGLLITRVNSQRWEIRLIAGDSAQRFSGVLDSSLPFERAVSTNATSADSAKLMTSTSLGTTLVAEAGRTDGLTFTVSPDAKLCLRDTGSNGVRIYMGESLQHSIALKTAPVALTGIDSCGDAAAPLMDATAQAMGASSGRKFHVGHWIVMGENASSQSLMLTALQPGVIGIMKRYAWYSMESTQGVYNFSELKSDLAWAAAHGTRLIAMVEDKTFNGKKAGPAYLNAYEAKNNMGGYTIVRWNPAVVTRFNALIKALGTQFDKNANFEGIATQESALSLDPAPLKQFGYTPEKYRDALISVLSSASASLPTSRVFWFMNFLVGNQNYIATIASSVAPKGVIMGGPDVWPDNASLQSRVYPFYSQFAGKMPLFGQVENVCYDEPHMTKGFSTKYWTMLELFTYAKTKLHVNYMFWVRVTSPSAAGAYDWMNALPVIAANRTWTPTP
jgi:hypothetical protein